MLKAERRVEMTWEGTLVRGPGAVKVGSGATEALPMTWATRSEQADGKTSPEELLAAAHAGCYAMALAQTLTEAGNPPESLRVAAVCTLAEVEEKPKITSMKLEAHGKVAGMDAASFAQAAQKAEQRCVVSNALRPNVAIQLTARLEA
ncbi:MAG: OsmC family peroxiredoxin [Ktedonobacteraceae bacterium]